MPEKTLNEVFSEIADAIREKSESSETIKPINMATAIEEIPTGPSLDNDSLYTVDGSGSPTKVGGGTCVVTTGAGSPVIRNNVQGGYYYNAFYNEEDHALDFEQLETNTYINGSGSTRTLDVYSTYYVSGESGGDTKFLASGYYHIIDGDSNEPSILEGLDGADVYRFDGDATFEVLSSFPQEDGYYYYASNDSKMFTPAVGAEEGSYYYIWNEELQQQDLTEGYYHYSNDSAALTPYTPGPTPEKGKYYYGNALTAQTLNSETLYWKGYGDNSSLTSVNLTSGNAYKYSGDTSFYEIRYFPESFGWYYYGMSGSDEFSRTKLADGLHQIQGATNYDISLTADNYYQYTVNGQGRMEFTPYTPGPSGGGEPGYYYYEDDASTLHNQDLSSGYMFGFNDAHEPLEILSEGVYSCGSAGWGQLPLEDQHYYRYTAYNQNLVPYTPSGSGEAGHYYYGSTPSDQTLVADKYYLSEGSGSALVEQQFASGEYYEYTESDLPGYPLRLLRQNFVKGGTYFIDDILGSAFPVDLPEEKCIASFRPGAGSEAPGCSDLELTENNIYQYGMDEFGDPALTQVQLTAGSTYTWNGHSFIPYSSQEEIDAAINELTGKAY